MSDSNCPSIPERSFKLYEMEYDRFMEWKRVNNASFSDADFCAYFEERSQSVAPTSLWCIRSKLKAFLMQKHKVDIEHYEGLLQYIKQKCDGYCPQKSLTLEEHHINEFLEAASDQEYVVEKAIIVIGIWGSLRGCELYNIKLSNVTDNGDLVMIRVFRGKTQSWNEIFITKRNDERNYMRFFRNYHNLRKTVDMGDGDQYFLQIRKGKCHRQHVSKNAISQVPTKIATFLDLPDAKKYTGHMFRKKSTSFTVNSGNSGYGEVRKADEWKSQHLEPEISNSLVNNLSHSMFVPLQTILNSPERSNSQIPRPKVNRDYIEPPEKRRKISNSDEIPSNTNDRIQNYLISCGNNFTKGLLALPKHVAIRFAQDSLNRINEILLTTDLEENRPNLYQSEANTNDTNSSSGSEWVPDNNSPDSEYNQYMSIKVEPENLG